jgi:hypothetical protein
MHAQLLITFIYNNIGLITHGINLMLMNLEMDVQLKLIQTIYTDNIKNQMILQWVSYPKSSWN